jgi:hypothetical protein
MSIDEIQCEIDEIIQYLGSTCMVVRPVVVSDLMHVQDMLEELRAEIEVIKCP